MTLPRAFVPAVIALGSVAIWLLSAAAPALAEKRVALVIGNGAYQSAPRLPNPRNDAEDVAAALKRTGFETIVGLDLDKNGMDDAAIRFSRAAREAEVAVFYYSGHAMQYAGVNYLMPIDARLTDEADLRRMARVDDILADLQQAKNLRILVLDSCRDNPLAEDLKRSIGKTRGVNIQRGLAKIDNPQGMIVAYATQSGRTAEDGTGRNSPYTSAFLKHIEAPEEIGTVFRHVSADVYAETHQTQLPELSLSLIGEFYLRGRSTVDAPPAAIAARPAVSDRETAARADYELALGAGTKAGWDAYLQKYRTGFYADLARSQRDRLAALDAAPAAAASRNPTLTVRPNAPAPPVTAPRVDAASAAELKWRLQSTAPAKTLTTLPLFARRVRELSDGRMNVDLLPAGAAAGLDVVNAVSNGFLDLAYAVGIYLAPKDRAFALMTAVPFGFTPRDNAAFRRRPDVAAVFDRLLAKQNLVAMPCGSFGRPGYIWSKNPLTVSADFSGLKMRAAVLVADVYKELGGVVGFVAIGDIAPALNRGQFDAAVYSDPKNDLDAGLPGAAKYFYYPGSLLPASTIDLFVNKAKWEALPPANRQIVEQACRESLDAMLDDSERLDKEALTEIARRGVTVAPLPAAIERDLYAASGRVMTKLAGQNEAVRALMAIVGQMRPSTVAAKLP
jgi:TRAP-type mannitol/chloroaromatic compound transport system substrate-binding protein/uncharacterized caspase-like protein